MEKFKKIARKMKVKEIKSKVKVRALDDEEEEEVVIVHRRSPTGNQNIPIPSKKLADILKPRGGGLERQLPDSDEIKPKKENAREEVSYERANAASRESKISYQSGGAGKMENYIGKDKYHTIESMNAEDKLAAERRMNSSNYAERNPFEQGNKYEAKAHDSYASSQVDETKKKENEQKRHQRMFN